MSVAYNYSRHPSEIKVITLDANHLATNQGGGRRPAEVTGPLAALLPQPAPHRQRKRTIALDTQMG